MCWEYNYIAMLTKIKWNLRVACSHVIIKLLLKLD